MEIRFRTRKLQKQYEKSLEAENTYGQVVRKHIQRVNIIKQAHDIDELCALPGLRWHALKGARQGRWAVKLKGYYRWIFTLERKKVESVRIGEVSEHYDD